MTPLSSTHTKHRRVDLNASEAANRLRLGPSGIIEELRRPGLIAAVEIKACASKTVETVFNSPIRLAQGNRLQAALFCLLLAFACRHGLSQSPWFQAQFAARTDQLMQLSQSVSRLEADALQLAEKPDETPQVGVIAAGQERGKQALSAEQRRLADFIVDRYRAASDVVHDIVSASYAIAKEQRVDPLLILAMVAVESQFDPLAQSPRGAQGLMQILTRVHAARFEHLGGVAAVFDPVTNLRVGVGILKEYLSRDATLEQALKTYVGAANLPSDRGYGQKVLLARSQLEEVAKAASR
ncbi:MAG: lytic transglycosylase domain-containing protein [Betaproteobacteria bacterium]|nr:lytic transglycosylase domain-containing protein [Betaproteobacteria bacterium]